jgi:4-hydroxybenzoate polyprenyltransferase
VSDWRHIVQVSRPLAWVNTALPFLAAAFAIERGLTPAIVIGTLYFLGPYNLLLHGTDDVVAAHGGDSGEPDHARAIRVAIVATNLPFLVVLVLLSGAGAGLALALAVAAAIVDTTPPLRTRERPVLDVFVGAMLVVLPAASGFLVAGLAPAELPWLALVAFAAWAVASFTLRAIRDVDAARAAGTATIATALGGRMAAIAALAGYVIAAALAATQGPLGALAALGLDLYLLLPAMILFSKRGDPVAEGTAARRAWSGFRGLNYLVGFWLAQLVLRGWNVTGFTAWEIAIGTSAVVVGYAAFNVLAIRLATRRRRPRGGIDDADVASVTIVVPSRDEALRLPDCLDALRDQTYADTTILVVDDGSTDGTAEVAAELLGGAGQVVVAPPKPDDWTGKGWACQVGADAATTDLVMFVDADTILVPVATRILVEQLERRRLDLLSGLTRSAMPTAGERAAVPGFPLLLFGFVPVWLQAITRGRIPRLAFAYGPLMLVRREAYGETGGHGATRGSLRDDIDLARTFARAGRRVGTAHAADLAVTRHHLNADAAVAAWRRMFLPYVGGSLAVAIAVILIEVLAFLVPLVLPPLAFLTGAGTRILVASFVPLLLLGAMRLALTLTQRQPIRTIAWHPVTVGLTLLGQLASIVDHVIGRAPRWRGRIVELPARTSEPPA